MTTPLWRNLILEENGRGPHRLVALNRVRDVFDVAIAVIGVHQHRQIAGGDYVAYNRAMLSIMRQIDVWMGKACAHKRDSADLIGRVARELNELRRQGVVSDRQQKGSMLLKHLLPGEPSRGCLSLRCHRRLLLASWPGPPGPRRPVL